MEQRVTRRHFQQTLANGLGVGLGAGIANGWFSQLANAVASNRDKKRHCILLWMSGGPSQTDTFDMKPNHENGGEFAEIQTKVPGLRFSEHMPKLAEMSDQLAVVRGMSTKEGDHGRGTYLMRTGQKPMGPEQFPSLGASLANQLQTTKQSLPSNVSIGSFRTLNQEAFGPGFLGPSFGPLFVGATDVPGAMRSDEEGFPKLEVQSMKRRSEITDARMEHRLRLWNKLQSEFVAKRSGGAAASHHEVYESALRLMNSDDAKAFDLEQEPKKVREAYGANVFGQGCLLARRLIQRGVPFVEVSLGTGSSSIGWDTHTNNFAAVKDLSTILDNGWSMLMKDLAERGLLESTTIIWMGEFGRTPRINPGGGRDHFPQAWSTVLAGGGIAGGQAYGKTSDDGTTVIEGKVGVQELMATLVGALGLPSDASNQSPSGRPIPLSDGSAIEELLA